MDVQAPGIPEDDAAQAMPVGRSTPPEVVAQQAAIAQIGQRALEERSLAILLPEACELVARVLDADMTSIAELAADQAELRIVAGTGWRPGIVGRLVLGTGSNSMAGYTLARGKPVLVGNFAGERRFTVTESLSEHEAASGLTVRIGGPSSPYGTLAVFSKRPRRFTRDDITFVHAVANVLAAAVARVQTEGELRASRDELSAIMAGIDDGISVLDGSGVLVYANETAARISGYSSAAEMLAAPSDEIVGRLELVNDEGQPLDVDRLPSRRALAGENVRNAMVGFRLRGRGDLRWVRISAQSIRDDSGRVLRAVNTFHDVTDERWAREARAYVADAAAVLSTTLDPDEAAQRLASLTVPRLADYCTVSMLQPDGSIKLTALAHANPERLELVRELQRALPRPSVNDDRGSGRVIREGVMEAADVTPDRIDAASATDEQRALLHELELRAYVTVPLTGRHGPIGSLSLVMAESGRNLGEREQALALELGARAGIALDNARLYQAAEERRAELGTVLAALAEAVLVFDSSGTLRISNEAAETMLDNRLPTTLDELWTRVSPDGADPRMLGDGEAVEAELDGGGHWLELRRHRATSGNTRSAAPTVVVMRDVTELRAARAARDAFMGVLSHELRTPVTTIYGGSELLERNLDEERRSEVIADIRAESERLARLVEDLLVMTRVERGIVEIADEPILLQHLIASVVKTTRARWSEAKINLATGERLPAVRGDATYIEQVLRNLLTNAMRYGDGLNSGIEIRASHEGEFVSVRVLDRGPGFQGEDPERLFELFYRTSSARSVPGGAGIGLFVCRSLIEGMGGEVWARERPEGGAEFGFSVPVLEADSAA